MRTDFRDIFFNQYFVVEPHSDRCLFPVDLQGSFFPAEIKSVNRQNPSGKFPVVRKRSCLRGIGRRSRRIHKTSGNLILRAFQDLRGFNDPRCSAAGIFKIGTLVIKICRKRRHNRGRHGGPAFLHIFVGDNRCFGFCLCRLAAAVRFRTAGRFCIGRISFCGWLHGVFRCKEIFSRRKHIHIQPAVIG